MQLINKWHKDFVKVDALPPEGYFPGPPRIKPIADNGISSGKNSWMLMSEDASFMSMDLSMVQSDDYFATTHIANQTFSYAKIVITNKKNTKTTQFNDDNQKDAFSDITGTRTSTTDTAFKRDSMERLQAVKDKEHLETRAVIKEQRRKIQKLKENHLKNSQRNNQLSTKFENNRQKHKKTWTIDYTMCNNNLGLKWHI